MGHNIQTVIKWFFRWGEHATFVVDLANFFGVQKMVISFEGGLLAALANWSETTSPFWKVMSGLAGFTLTLVAINVFWGLFNNWQISKHQILAVATEGPGSAGHELIIERPLIASADRSLIACEKFVGGEVDGWEKLYNEYDAANGKELRLRFLPDTDDQASDALLLICYGYKIIRKIDAIPRRFASNQIEYLLQNAPGTRQSYIAGFMASINTLSQERDFGKKCKDEGTVELVALSEGGKYRITAWGENKARELACDLIARAT